MRQEKWSKMKNCSRVLSWIVCIAMVFSSAITTSFSVMVEEISEEVISEEETSD